MLDGQLGNLSDVVPSGFLSKTGETKSGLTTSSVLLRQVDRELVHDLSRVTGESAEQRSVTVTAVSACSASVEHDTDMTMKPHFESFSNSSSSASTWNLLSHMYNELRVSWHLEKGDATYVLIGLNGVKANEIFFSLPSSFSTVPTKTQRPLSGTASELSRNDRTVAAHLG